MLNDNLKTELQALLPGQAAPSRRSALKAALGVGYAASAMPIVAQTAIKTAADGLQTGEISFEVNGFKVPAYFAAPAGKKKLPVVLVVHEIFGVHEYIADTVRRLAKAGYLAIAPELFARQGDPSQYGEMARLMAEVVSKVPDAQVMADLDGAVHWAASHGGDTRKLAITGFCYGGRIAWLYAAHNPGVKAGVAWYGRLVGQTNALTPQHPIDVAAKLHGPVLGLYGGADAGIPVDTVARMQEALAAGNRAAKASQFVLFRDAPHAFHADYRPSYRKAAADEGWQQALAWFKAQGVA